MRRKHTGYLTLAALVVWAMSSLGTGCKEENPLKFSTKVNNENLCHEVAEVMCANVFDCCRGEQIERDFGVKITTSELDCRIDMELLCEERTATLQNAIKAGRVTLRAEQINACLKASRVGKAGCYPYVSEFAKACEETLFQGTQTEGQACIHEGESFECAGSGFCGPDRKCHPRPGEGEECNATVGCVSGTYCDISRDPEAPEYGTDVCQDLKQPGDGCYYTDLTAAEYVQECVAGSICFPPDEGEELPEGDPPFSGTCTPQRALEEECTIDELCQSGYCLAGTCEGEGVCFSDSNCMGVCQSDGTTECMGDEWCWGTCEASGAACNIQNSCANTCRESGRGCNTDEDCGRCSETGEECDVEADCNTWEPDTSQDTDSDSVVEVDTGPAPQTCEFTDTCVQNDECQYNDVCEGSAVCEGRVCARRYFTWDFCGNSLIERFVVAPLPNVM